MPLYYVLLRNLFPGFYLHPSILSFLMMIRALLDTTHFKKARNTVKRLSILFYRAFHYVLSEKYSHIHLNIHGYSSLWCVRGGNENNKSKDDSKHAAIKLADPFPKTGNANILML